MQRTCACSVTRTRDDWLTTTNSTRRLSPSRPDPVLGSPNDLTRLIRDHAIEYVVVTSPDWTHGDYITKSLHAGADVIVEKPIATTAEACRKVVEAVAATGRSVRVTFNYRYAARNSKLREIVQAGAVGTVTSVHFEWLLDTSHGADYFRRWHRDKANSGGLLVHKASHHFDLVNWWIDRRPRRVFASGELRFYGSNNYARRAAQEGQSARIDMGDPFDQCKEPALVISIQQFKNIYLITNPNRTFIIHANELFIRVYEAIKGFLESNSLFSRRLTRIPFIKPPILRCDC